ncbi:GGDEF domain-containing protein [Aquincola sp. S2]|uniref:diguanylate cyclase n=1 Tax=Pseudaquabacterium terrae TaxID=2732868 RepID=A0ABX2EEX9_9BURK|nr:GGDEF domain-containing protein [Aquabacterium terrae]NRF67162.1 GGDEF domain-containing protein [Aquabacterium terrae]
MGTEDTTVIMKTGDHSLVLSLGPSAQRRSCLIVYSGAETGKRYVLDGRATTIGRLADMGVFIDHPSVSRRHAELELAGDVMMIRDLGSANGTWVNDIRLPAPQALKDGDLIRLGKVFLKYYEQENLDVLLHDRIYRMATVDAGTEIFNRQYLVEFLKGEFKLAKLTGRPLSVVYYDLDFFKSVNDNYGHGAGDQVLKESAGVIKTVVRKDDLLGRLGGEEFVVVLPNTVLAVAAELAERMRAAVEAHDFVLAFQTQLGRRSVTHRQTISLGVAQLGEPMQESPELLEAADAALYRAKRGGRNRVDH